MTAEPLIAKAVVVAASVWDEVPPLRRARPLHGFAATAVVIRERGRGYAHDAARKVPNTVPRAPGSGSPARPP
jgi:hypothetical protein